MDKTHKDTPVEENVPQIRGLYRHLKIPVKALDWTIIACIAVILIVFIFEIGNLGFTVTFDSRGGTDVETQTDVLHTELLTEPEPPTREGYRFTGWYMDQNCVYAWNFQEMYVSESMTLYAGWEKIE